jgi:hypothetical protein
VHRVELSEELTLAQAGRIDDHTRTRFSAKSPCGSRIARRECLSPRSNPRKRVYSTSRSWCQNWNTDPVRFKAVR